MRLHSHDKGYDDLKLTAVTYFESACVMRQLLPPMLPFSRGSGKSKYFEPDVFVLTSAFAEVFGLQACIGDYLCPVLFEGGLATSAMLHSWAQFEVGRSVFLLDLMPLGGVLMPALVLAPHPLYEMRSQKARDTPRLSVLQAQQVTALKPRIEEIAVRYRLYELTKQSA